jgi:hypothetical protein
LPALTEKDRSDILFGVENGIDFIAASFVRKAADVTAIRELIGEAGKYVKIISVRSACAFVYTCLYLFLCVYMCVYVFVCACIARPPTSLPSES